MTLHGITFDDRSVLSRLSVCEMVVPYGMYVVTVICNLSAGLFEYYSLILSD